MPRATKILRAGAPRPVPVSDTLILDFDKRQTKQGFFFTGKGTCIELDFAEPPALATDDALVLDDGALIEIVADAEPLIEARIPDAAALARMAWRLGDRHVPVQIFANRLRVRRNAEVEALLAGVAAKVTPLTAPFEADGASTHAGHDHHHDHHHHDHGHGHDHHHDHEHARGNGHHGHAHDKS
jgi:urease accessory protein